MAISFSGLASGMDTSSWVEALVSVKQSEITKLESNRSTVAAAQDTLNNVKSYFSSFQSLLENITDARFGIASRDLFTQNLAESSNVSALTATASTSAENTTYNIEVKQLATATEVSSGLDIVVPSSQTNVATLNSTLFSIADEDHNIIAGDITFSIDNNIRTISIDNKTTISDFINLLDGIGVSASYDENSGIFSLGVSVNNDDASFHLKTDSTGVIAALGLEDVNYGYKTETVNIVTTTTVTGTATLDSKLKDLFVGADKCDFDIVDKDGHVTHIANEFNTESTLGDVLSRLEDFGITTTLNKDGSLTLTSDKNGNVFKGNLAQALRFEEVEEPYISQSKHTSTDIVHSTIETIVSRDSTLEQIGAIQNAGDNIIIRECDGGEAIATISSLTTSSSVQDLFNALTAYGITGSVSDGVIKLSSTSGNYVDGNIATNIGILHPVTETHYTTAPITMTSPANINTATTLGALGMSSDGSVIIDSPVYGIVSVNIAKELTVQQFCDKINDSNYGIHAEIDGNRVKITELAGSGAYVKSMTPILQDTLKLHVGEDLSYDSTTINVYTNTDSSYLKYNDIGVEINGDTVISSLNGYSQGTGEILLHHNTVTLSNGVFSTINTTTTIMVDDTLTLEEFINNPIVGLAQYGITGQVLSDGKAYLSSDGELYLEEVAGGSNILSALKMSDLQQTVSGQHVKGIENLQYTLTITTTVAATNETELSTWDKYKWNDDNTSLIPDKVAEGSLVFKVNDYYKTIDITNKDTFESLINKLDGIGIKASISRGVFYIESGYDDVEFIENESSSSLASLIGLNTTSQNLGSYSSSSAPVKSTVTTENPERISAASYADMNTKLSTMNISSGKLTVYENGRKADINISDDETFSSFQSKLATAFSDLRVGFEDGFLKIYSDNANSNISIGATSDKSNFVAITGIHSVQGNEQSSSRQLYKMGDKTTLGTEGIFRALGDGEKIQAGSFKVGDADIYIQEENGQITTTMADIVSQINASDKSLATAYWDSIDGKLVIKSTLTGASAVNIEAGTTNLTDVLGLTDGDNLVMNSQAIGKNAVLTINGASYTSLSNNVTSDSTGITGLTINLKGLTEGSAVQLTVKRDTETLKNAVQNVVDGYNELISNIDTVIAKDGKLKNQSLLKLIRNNIRTAMTSSDSGTSVFKNLSSIGIKASDAAAGNISTSNSAITLLSLDADEFLKAFESDGEAVKALLIGSNDASGAVINKGIFTKVEELIESALTAGSGYFATANNAYNSEKENISQKIIKGTAAIEKYRVRLEKKFSAMDIMIAGMQNQFQSFLS